jgi:hypothetical protein
MSRVNDVGGMEGFPPLVHEVDEPPFTRTGKRTSLR